MAAIIDQIKSKKGQGWHFYSRAKNISRFEFASSAIHQAFLQQAFPFPEYSVIGEQSPNDKSRRRVDTVVSYHEEEYDESTTLVLCEFKRDEKDVQEVEDQVVSAAKIWLRAYKGAQVFAYTTRGVKARTWYVNKKENCKLEPLFGGEKGHKDEYVDISGSKSHLILNSFAYMRGEIDFQDIEIPPSDDGGDGHPIAGEGYYPTNVATTQYNFEDPGGPSGTRFDY